MNLNRMKKKTKKYWKYQLTWLLSFAILVTGSWFVWKTWDKVDTLLGGGNLPYIIAGAIVFIAIVFGIGHLTFKKFAEKFT